MDNLIIKALIDLLKDSSEYVRNIESINGAEEESQVLIHRLETAIKALENL